MTRALPLCALALALTAPTASAGWWHSHTTDLVRPQAGRAVALSGSVRAYKLTSTHGRTVMVRLPRPASLSEPLALPEGPWAELTLLLDGPLVLDGVVLEVDTLTVPLTDPDATEVQLEWTLPDSLAARLRGGPVDEELRLAVVGALEDGGVATP